MNNLTISNYEDKKVVINRIRKGWDVPADEKTIEKTILALKANNIEAMVVDTEKEAKERLLEFIPEGAEVMNNTSVTLQKIGVTEELSSGKYNFVRDVLTDPNADPRLKKKLGAAAEYAVGSVHAVTEDGHVMIASGSGSNLPTYANGADHVIWVVGTQKIVKNIDEGMKRIYEYSLPLESERANKAYNSTAGSAVRKLLIINEEKVPNRLHVIFIRENIGF
jgi:L-lactate utilization protein LutC